MKNRQLEAPPGVDIYDYFTDEAHAAIVAPSPLSFWPAKAPLRPSLTSLVQTQYSLLLLHNGVLTVHIHTPASPSGKFFRRVPLFLLPVLREMFWRQWAMTALYLSTPTSSSSSSSDPKSHKPLYTPWDTDLRRYLRYTDLVLHDLWETLLITPSLSLSPSSPLHLPRELTRWLTIDYHVGRHSPLQIEAWEMRAGMRIEDAPFVLEEWVVARQREFPAWMTHEGYRWAWGDVPTEVREAAVREVERWLEGEAEVTQKLKERKKMGKRGTGSQEDPIVL